MLFNSNFFLYVFLPIFLLIYYAISGVTKRISFSNIILLLFSLLFYFCTGGLSIIILLAVIVLNFLCALFMDFFEHQKKLFLFLGVIGNLGILMYFKYAAFFYENYLIVMKALNVEVVEKAVQIILPVGISFYIFQGMSYIIDVYGEKVPVQKNIINFALYIALFPQLIAGPIVRYETVYSEISVRSITTSNAYWGGVKFIYGLGKKVLVADILGQSVDAIWSLSQDNLTTSLAWGAAFLYTLQIYFDFSGYSDMAIGLGRMLGFHFLENFQQPYTAENVSQFWKKWHISLSSFLKDYLYIPLGGNRKGILRTYMNLLIVFIACGLWHGAAWNFVVWGGYHGFFLVVERILKHRYNFEMKGLFGRLFTFFIVMIGWVFFRAPSVRGAFEFIKVMLGMEKLAGFQYYEFGYYIYLKITAVAIIAFIGVFFKFNKLRERLDGSIVKGIIALVILVVSMAYMSDASFTPFIYFQF